MKKSVNNEIKVNVKDMNAVTTGVAKKIQAEKKEAKNERKNITQTINYLCSAETEAGIMFRDFFGLVRTSNKEARKKAAKYISMHYARALAVYTEEWVELENRTVSRKIFRKYVPCTRTGKEITDYLDVITEIVKIERVNRPKRMELGRQMKKLWQSEGAKNEPDKVRYATALKNTFKKHLDKLNVQTVVLGEIRK